MPPGPGKDATGAQTFSGFLSHCSLNCCEGAIPGASSWKVFDFAKTLGLKQDLIRIGAQRSKDL